MKLKLVAAFGMLMVLVSGCGADEPASDTPTSTNAVTSSTTATTTVAPSSPVADTPVEPVLEPTIVGCQGGYNAVETTWSDGTVTGYSDYCQSVRDQFVQNSAPAPGRVVNPPEMTAAPDQDSCVNGTTRYSEDSGITYTCREGSWNEGPYNPDGSWDESWDGGTSN